MSSQRGSRPQIKSHANPRKAKRMWVFGNRISRIDTRVTRPYSSLSQIQKADPWTHGDMLPSKRTVKKALNAEKGAFCMSRKNKISSELKKKVVRMCKSGQVSQAEAARRCGVSESTIKRWLSRERSEGCAGLESEATNRVYPSELKLQAVTAYLTGKYSHDVIYKGWITPPKITS